MKICAFTVTKLKQLEDTRLQSIKCECSTSTEWPSGVAYSPTGVRCSFCTARPYRTSQVSKTVMTVCAGSQIGLYKVFIFSRLLPTSTVGLCRYCGQRWRCVTVQRCRRAHFSAYRMQYINHCLTRSVPPQCHFSSLAPLLDILNTLT